jgi:hypothetical protein
MWTKEAVDAWRVAEFFTKVAMVTSIEAWKMTVAFWER